MAIGVYERTAETRANMAAAHRGRKGREEAAGFYVDAHGYRVLTGQYGHPLASPASRGSEVKEHRKVLYDTIGPGPHLCHWCGRQLEWGGSRGICVDHLDDDRLNNDPSNLVPSCNRCNSKRGIKLLTHCQRGHKFTPENTYVRPTGQRNCRTCRRR